MNLTELIHWLDRLFQQNAEHLYIVEQTERLKLLRKQLMDAYHYEDSRVAVLAQLQELINELTAQPGIHYDGIKSPDKLTWVISDKRTQRIEWDEPKVIALLDVDHTLCYFHGDDIIFNQILLDALKAHGMEDIYLFTDMTFNSNNLEIRKKVIDELHEQGFTVHGVVTPNDYLWNHVTLLANFEHEFDGFSVKNGISLKYSRGLDRVKAFFELNNGKYKSLLSIVVAQT